MLVPAIFELCHTASDFKYQPAFRAVWSAFKRDESPETMRDLFVAVWSLLRGQVPWGEDAYSDRILKLWFINRRIAAPEVELLIKKWEIEAEAD